MYHHLAIPRNLQLNHKFYNEPGRTMYGISEAKFSVTGQQVGAFIVDLTSNKVIAKWDMESSNAIYSYELKGCNKALVLSATSPSGEHFSRTYHR